MNYLQLVQQLHQEAGGTGAQPTTTVSQTGERKRFVDWINQAWVHVQGLQDSWRFMRGTFSFTTTPSQGEYTVAQAGVADLRYWFTDTIKTYKTATGIGGEYELDFLDYNSFRAAYRRGNRPEGPPAFATLRLSDDALMLGPIPDAGGYTVYGEYQKRPSELSGDSDTPELSSDLQMVIVYKAMQFYALYEGGAPEVMARGVAGYNETLGRMLREQLPPMLSAETLV